MKQIAFTKTPASPRVFTAMIAMAVLSVVALFPAAASAQRDANRPNIEDLLPETTIAFAQIADIRDLVEKTSDGAMAKLIQDEEVAPLFGRVVEEGRKAYDKVEDQVGLSFDEVLEALPSGEMMIGMIAPRRQKPVFIVMLEIGEDNEAADKALGVLRDKIEEAGVVNEDEELESGVEVEKIRVDDTDVFMAQREGMIIACTDEKELNNIFLRWDGEEIKKVRPLSKNRKFITIMNRCKSQKELPNDMRFYFDPIGTYKSSARGNIGMQTALAFFPAIGLDTIRAFGGSIILGDEEYESIMHGHLLLANPRKGITKVISLKPGEYQPELWMPADSMFYITTSWDVPQMYAELRGIFDLTMEEGTFDNFVRENIDENLDMSLEEDVLAQLSGRVSITQISIDPGKLNSASVIVGLGLNEVEEAKSVMRNIMSWANENTEAGFEEAEHEGFTYWTRSEEAIEERRAQREKWREERRTRRGDEDEDEGREALRATVRTPRSCFAIVGDSIVMTDSIEAFHAIAATFNGETPSLANDEDFIKTSEKMTRLLGTDMPVALSYSQPKNQFLPWLDYANSDKTREYLSTQREEGEFWGTLNSVLDDHDLPSAGVLDKYMVPQGWFVTSDDTGYHMLWFQERLELEDE